MCVRSGLASAVQEQADLIPCAGEPVIFRREYSFLKRSLRLRLRFRTLRQAVTHLNALSRKYCHYRRSFDTLVFPVDRLCGVVVRVLGYRSRGPGSIPGSTRKKKRGLERGQIGLVSTTEELLDIKVAAPV
jgi:hypothetical protein